MKTEKIIEKARSFERELRDYYNKTEGCEVPDIETTVIGSGGVIHYEVRDREVVRTEKDSHNKTPFIDSWPISDPWAMEECYDQITYDRRRLRKGWRVWKSENPDAELARDDD